MKNKVQVIGLGAGMLYGLIARLLFALDPKNEFIEVMSLTFLFGIPAVTGAITVYFGSEAQRKDWVFRITAPWLTVAGLFLVTFITLLEATLCIVMLSPAFMIAASLGGMLMGEFLTERGRTKNTLPLLVLLPFVAGPAETRLESPSRIYRVTTQLVIHADKREVWENIKSVPAIREEELTWSFAHAVGLPHPVSSRLNGEGIGGVRKIEWEKGIRFREILTEWEPYEKFTYRIVVDSFPTRAVDRHIEVGGKYFDVLTGGYQLEAIDAHTTRLTLHCRYRVTSKFNWYCKWWGSLLLDDFQRVILRVIKGRSEEGAARQGGNQPVYTPEHGLPQSH